MKETGRGGGDVTLPVTASVYKRPQTAAAPTLSSPYSGRKSVNKDVGQ